MNTNIAYQNRCRVICGAALGMATFLMVIGCGSRKNSDYVPISAQAREAVVKSLEAWKLGQPAGLVEGKPAIQVVDTHRREHQTLESYEILGEHAESGGRRFSVEVMLANPNTVEKVDYIVIGIDPLWVMHKDDYNAFGHWEHNMPAGNE